MKGFVDGDEELLDGQTVIGLDDVRYDGFVDHHHLGQLVLVLLDQLLEPGHRLAQQLVEAVL
jgi:hypothetical protein